MPTFKDSTKLQMFQELRARYKDSTKPEILKIARRFWQAIQNAEITDAQIKNAFNINDAQLATLKTKFQNQSATADSISSTTGQ